jgi:S1-C subfamily serine protease
MWLCRIEAIVKGRNNKELKYAGSGFIFKGYIVTATHVIVIYDPKN